IEVIDDRLHLFGGQILEAREDDHEVGALQRLRSGNIRFAGLDGARLGVDAEKDRAFEAVMLREDARQRWQRLLRLVFVIAGDEDDMLALAGAAGALVNKRRSLRDGGASNNDECGSEEFHGLFSRLVQKAIGTFTSKL